MELPSYFSDFIRNIRLTPNQKNELITGHRTLRNRLHSDEELSPVIVNSFLQGSYRRATAVRPRNNQRSDVDVILVTKLSKEEYTPDAALSLFEPFLNKHYKDKYRIQGRSIGIELSYVELDLVITSAPSESEVGIMSESNLFDMDETLEELDSIEEVKELTRSWFARRSWNSQNVYEMLREAVKSAEWKLSPLYIPNREAKHWEQTHPLAQIQWTWNKNKICNHYYLDIVKAIKWWRKVKHPDMDHPKGYPLEHLVGQCCPDGITSIAQGFTRSLENIVSTYQGCADTQQTPFLPDHGVPSHNVLGRISGIDFAKFHEKVAEVAVKARQALDSDDKAESVTLWREIFGNEFPDIPSDNNSESGPNDGNNTGGFTPRKDRSIIGDGRFA